MNRRAKQALIGGLYLVVIIGCVWFAYRILVPAPTCYDGVQNGGEEGVDCGALACGVLCPVPVQSLAVGDVRIFPAGNGYDILARIDNPNPLYGASRVEFTLTVADAQGEVITTRRGNTYVNPSQPTYLLFPLLNVSNVPTNVEFVIDAPQVAWSALTVDAKGDVQFAVRDELFTPTSTSMQFNATVLNRSSFDFDTVDVTVLLYDDDGSLVGAGATIQRTLIAGESRDFTMTWPFAVAGAVRVQTIVMTNVFANDNYIRTYGSQERFQGL